SSYPTNSCFSQSWSTTNRSILTRPPEPATFSSCVRQDTTDLRRFRLWRVSAPASRRPGGVASRTAQPSDPCAGPRRPFHRRRMSPLEPSGISWASLLLRLGLAVVAGGLIGWERHRAGKPAGLRTHMLVGLGAALFVLAVLDDAADAASRVTQG